MTVTVASAARVQEFLISIPAASG
ncbi:hypothetical protein SMALA_5988 [Streptomyces malaysiensis subsp. malaysiensis]|nr:hypothetical protein SMALA_5988 [Streptomyces malaysiensis]